MAVTLAAPAVPGGHRTNAESVPSMYHVRVHPDARHGFDNAGSAGSDADSDSRRPADLEARDAALESTLERLSDHLGSANH